MIAQLGYLVVREIRTRYTGDLLGYAWAYVTPLAWIGVIYATFVFAGRQPSIATDLLSFIISGMLPYLVFRYTVAALLRARPATLQFRAMAGTPLVMHLLAVALVEFYNGLLIYAALGVVNWTIVGHAELADPLLALLGFTLAWAIGAAFGVAVVALSDRIPALPRLIPTILRPVFFLSGIFFTANELPAQLVAVLQYNPLLDVVEIVRTGVFRSYSSRYLDVQTPLLFIVACLGIAALAMRPGRVAAR